MARLIEFSEAAAKSPVAFAVVLTAYILLTFTCAVFMSDLPEAKEQMSWFDFLRSLVSAVAAGAFFFSLTSVIQKFTAGQLSKTIFFAAMVAASFVLTAKIKKVDCTEHFVRTIHYVLTFLFSIFGIIMLIVTLTKG